MKFHSPETFCRLYKGRKLLACHGAFLQVPWHNRRPVVDANGVLTGECVWRDPQTGEIPRGFEYAETIEDGSPHLMTGLFARACDAVVSRGTAIDLREMEEEAKRENGHG